MCIIEFHTLIKLSITFLSKIFLLNAEPDEIFLVLNYIQTTISRGTPIRKIMLIKWAVVLVLVVEGYIFAH